MGGLGVFGALGVIVAIFAAVFVGLWAIFGLLNALIVYFLAVSVVMMLVILIQRPKGGGLSGAFGGAGGGGQSQTAFGAKVGDVLTWVTVSCFVLFLGFAMAITWEQKRAGAAVEKPKVEQQAGAEGEGGDAGAAGNKADGDAAS